MSFMFTHDKDNLLSVNCIMKPWFCFNCCPLLSVLMIANLTLSLCNLVSSQIWFAFVNGFSGQILFERWCIGLYNVVSVNKILSQETQLNLFTLLLSDTVLICSSAPKLIPLLANYVSNILKTSFFIYDQLSTP